MKKRVINPKSEHPTQDEFDVATTTQEATSAEPQEVELVEAEEMDDVSFPTLPDILTFRGMLQNVKVRSKEDAVILRQRIQDVESVLEKWKDMADRYLFNSCKKCE